MSLPSGRRTQIDAGSIRAGPFVFWPRSRQRDALDPSQFARLRPDDGSIVRLIPWKTGTAPQISAF